MTPFAFALIFLTTVHVALQAIKRHGPVDPPTGLRRRQIDTVIERQEVRR